MNDLRVGRTYRGDILVGVMAPGGFTQLQPLEAIRFASVLLGLAVEVLHAQEVDRREQWQRPAREAKEPAEGTRWELIEVRGHDEG